jgi:hypothetical protein
MTLGPALLALAGLEAARGGAARLLVTFGRVPLFYCLAHLLLLHALAVIFAAVTLGDAAWLVGASPIGGKPAGSSLGLPGVDVAWGLAVAMLYPPCRWFAEVKRRRDDGWLSYL